MKFRERLVLAASITSLVGLGGGLVFVYGRVNVERESHVDHALGLESREEADEIAQSSIGAALPEDPDLSAAEVGPLHKYVVLYDASGAVIGRSPLVGQAVPSFESLQQRDAKPFDVHVGKTNVRAVLLPIPGRPGQRMLFGVSRDPLDLDASLLARVMSITFGGAVIWIVAMTWSLANRMTREHAAIAAVARRVAAGDLGARVAGAGRDEDVVQLGRDIDAMIEQLSELVKAQQRFVSYAAHELRSPITVAYGELSNALRKERPAAYYKEAITSALDATSHMRTLAEDLLVLARGGAPAGKRRPAPLAAAALSAAQQLGPNLHPRGVTVQIIGDAVVETANERDLQRLLLNLIDNAAKHSPRDGVVHVSIEKRDGAVQLAVEDEGPGVQPGDAERIFEPFFRGEDQANKEGSGLGLAIVRAIARAHDGDISLEGKGAHGGARFVVRFG